jgi:hypothetical protein
MVHVLDPTKGEVIVNSGIGSHTPYFSSDSSNADSVIENIEGCSLAGPYDNPMPELTLSPSQGSMNSATGTGVSKERRFMLL